MDFFVVHQTQSDIGGSVRCMSAESPCMSALGIKIRQCLLIFSADFGGLHQHVSSPDTTKISKKDLQINKSSSIFTSFNQ